MAERLKEEILNREKMVDILAGPDAYRDLPRLLAVAESGQQAANVLLSLDETYADVMPVQTSPSATSAFVWVTDQEMGSQLLFPYFFFFLRPPTSFLTFKVTSCFYYIKKIMHIVKKPEDKKRYSKTPSELSSSAS